MPACRKLADTLEPTIVDERLWSEFAFGRDRAAATAHTILFRSLRQLKCRWLAHHVVLNDSQCRYLNACRNNSA